ncbi:MAG: hypothetical protein GXY23_17445 [Myxococcales bacterium]|nr:hypothetical protein [Myxococcales bacterium]
MTLKAKIRGSIRSLSHGPTLAGARRAVRRGLRAVARKPLRVSFFHRVDDPESLIVAEALARLAERYGFSIDLVVVPEPAADVDPEPDLAMALARREAAWVAARYGLPPLPAEIEAPPPARVRLVQAILLKEAPPDVVFARAIELGRALFAGDGEAIAAAAKRYGTAAGPDVSPRLEANYRALRAVGHYAGATLIADGEIFHRVDRMPLFEARLRRADEPALFPLVGDEALSVSIDGPVQAFVSFQCPYSYLAIARLMRLSERYGFRIEERPIRPLVMRGLRVPPVKLRYALVDAAREAQRHGIPFGPFAEVKDPGVQRALFVWHEASRAGKGLAFVESALRGIWSEAADLEDDGDLFRLAARAGLDADVVERALEEREGLARAEAHREARRELGLWGVPSLEVGGIATWGQDRIPLLLERARSPRLS